MNTQNIAYTQYETYLSPFGRKVLSTLIKIRTESKRNINNFNELIRYKPSEFNKKRVIAFDDANVRHQIPSCEFHNATNSADCRSEFNSDNIPLISRNPDVLQPAALIETSPQNATNLSNEFITFNNNSLCNELENNDMIDIESPKKVDWNNFLDEELLPGIIDRETFIADNNIDKVFTKKSPIVNNVLNENVFNTEVQMIKKIKNRNNIPKSDGIRKKTKPSDETLVTKTKCGNRKQNYTTAVKNWLNDIDNTGAGYRTLNKQNSTNSDTINSLVVDTQKLANKSKNKRTVQAQLTNKDGVMKFKKPKAMKIVKTAIKDSVDFEPKVQCAAEGNTDRNDGSQEENMSPTRRTARLNNSNKNKKSKFVAPIKSQVPVKDAPFDVIVVNELGQCRALLESSPAEAAVATLVFGNGLSQLHHHTGDAGPPEGLMILINNIYYYFKGDEQNFEDLFLFILNKNVIGYDLKNILIFLMNHFSINIADIRLNLFDAQVGANLLEPDSPPADFTALQALVGASSEHTATVSDALVGASPEHTATVGDALVGASPEHTATLGDAFVGVSPDYTATVGVSPEYTATVGISPEHTATVGDALVGVSPDYAAVTGEALQACARLLRELRPCAERLRALLVERGLWKLFDDIEMQVLPVIAVMEHRGVCVDVEKLESMEKELLRHLKATELQCYAAAGKSFQINSALQVRTILYDELRLDARSNVKIRETICQGAKSTSEIMLRRLTACHPLPGLVLQYRQLHKAHAACLAGVAQRVRRGVVRPTWLQNAAATGRIACSNPNLQAIPKTPFSLDPFSDDKEPEGGGRALRLRSAYAARAGSWLLAADFRQAECRLLALQAGDGRLLAALAGPDLFRELAAEWLGARAADVSAAQRERTKRVVYGALYGAGGRRLAEVLGVPEHRALALLASFNRTFPSLKQFARRVADEARAAGGRVRTASGRVRDFPGLAGADSAARAHAERQAVNFVVQGLAADVCKLAMVRGARRLPGCRLLLQVHDELVWEVPRAELPAAADIIRSTMEECGREFGLRGPLPVALSRGPNWGDLTPMP